MAGEPPGLSRRLAHDFQSITIEVKGDRKREANQTFYLDLFDSSSNPLFTKNGGVGTVLNDD